MIPPEANAEFVCQMEEILELYTRPYNPDYPLFVDGTGKEDYFPSLYVCAAY